MIEDDEAITRLIDDLVNNEFARARAARDALIRIGDRAIAPLLDLLTNANVASVPHDPPRPMGAAGNVWNRDPDVRRDRAVRTTAAQTLASIGGEAIPALIAALANEHWVVRAIAATALGTTGDRRAVSPLIEVLRRDDSKRARFAEAEALVQLQDERAIAPLIETGEMVDTLLSFGEPAVLPILHLLMNRARDTRVRSWATWALGQLGDQRAVAPALAILMDATEASKVRQDAAMFVLGALGDQQVIDPLLTLAMNRTEEDEVRVAAIKALARLDAQRARDPIQSLIADPTENHMVRGAATMMLPLLAGEQAIAVLIGALDDADPEVRVSAADTLGRHGDERALPALERLRRDNTAAMTPTQSREAAWRVQQQAAQTEQAIVAIKRRCGLPLTAADDVAGAIIARYGRVVVREDKSQHRGASGEGTYYLRLAVDHNVDATPPALGDQHVDDSRLEFDLGQMRAPDYRRDTVARRLEAQQESLRRSVDRSEQELRDLAHADQDTLLQHHAPSAIELKSGIKLLKQLLHRVDQAIRELEGQSDDGRE